MTKYQELREQIAIQQCAWEFSIPLDTMQDYWDKTKFGGGIVTPEDMETYYKRADTILKLMAERGMGIQYYDCGYYTNGKCFPDNNSCIKELCCNYKIKYKLISDLMKEKGSGKEK